MKNSLYYPITIGFFLSLGVLGMFIDDLGVVFDFIGGVGMSFVCFTLPSLLYLILINREAALGYK